MLAKPEYFSLPDEACCWPGAMAELLLARGTVAELHREAFAGQGHRGGAPSGSFCWPGAPWWRAIGKLLLAGRCGEGAERPGALWQRSIGKKLLAGRREVCCWPGRYGGASAERRRYGGAFAGRGAAKCGKEGGALRWGPCAWGTQRWGRWAGAEALKPPLGDSAWEPVLGNLRGGPCAG